MLLRGLISQCRLGYVVMLVNVAKGLDIKRNEIYDALNCIDWDDSGQTIK